MHCSQTRAINHRYLIKLIYINKELQHLDIYMEVVGTPNPHHEIISTEFQGRMLTLNEPAPGKINASFDDMAQKFRYDIKDYTLDKINFKTVIAAIKGSHPQVLSAKFTRSEQDVHKLIITVSYEFLPPIAQELVFERREIPAEESEQAMIRGMRSYVRGIREQLNQIGSIQITSGELDATTDTQIFLRLVHKKTVFTWGLNLTQMSGTVIKPQMLYYSTITKQRKSSNAVPDSGVYVHNNGKAYVQIKFLAELEDFQMVIFQLQGANKGEYTIASEKVQMV